MFESRRTIMAVFLVSFLSSLAAQERSDTVYTFRFVPGKNMFYVSYKGNEAEIARLEKCVEQHRADILAGRGPCASTVIARRPGARRATLQWPAFVPTALSRN